MNGSTGHHYRCAYLMANHSVDTCVGNSSAKPRPSSMDTGRIRRTILEDWYANTKMQSMSHVILGNCVMASKLIMRQHADGTSRVNSAAALTPADFIV